MVLKLHFRFGVPQSRTKKVILKLDRVYSLSIHRDSSFTKYSDTKVGGLCKQTMSQLIINVFKYQDKCYTSSSQDWDIWRIFFWDVVVMKFFSPKRRLMRAHHQTSIFLISIHILCQAKCLNSYWYQIGLFFHMFSMKFS